MLTEGLNENKLAVCCPDSVVTLFAVPFQQPSMCRCYIDGQEWILCGAVIENGRILVPLRPFLNKMGATVEWVEAGKTATANKDE
jgi:hypothetical protein